MASTGACKLVVIMDIKMFMSPRLGRRSLSGSPAVGRKRNVFSREDENHLLQSPTDCEANEIINGNVIIEKNAPSSTTTQFGGPSSLPSQYHTPEVGFSFPNKLKTPVSQVCNIISLLPFYSDILNYALMHSNNIFSFIYYKF